MGSITESLEKAYRNALEVEDKAKALFDIENKKYNDARKEYDKAEVLYYPLAEENKRIWKCPDDGIEYIGSELFTSSICTYYRLKKHNASLMILSPHKWAAMAWESGALDGIKEIVINHRSALRKLNDITPVYESVKEYYDVARINTGKAYAELTNWKKENMTAEELAELDKDVYGSSTIDVFSWKTIGIGFGVLGLFLGIVWYINRR